MSTLPTEPMTLFPHPRGLHSARSWSTRQGMAYRYRYSSRSAAIYGTANPQKSTFGNTHKANYNSVPWQFYPHEHFMILQFYNSHILNTSCATHLPCWTSGLFSYAYVRCNWPPSSFFLLCVTLDSHGYYLQLFVCFSVPRTFVILPVVCTEHVPNIIY